MNYVSQCPSMFGMTFREGIALGAPLEPFTGSLSGKCYHRRQHALAYKFVIRLLAGYPTIRGNGGLQFCGG